jgi:V8-like Glu-specific endopeptidase
VRKLVQLAGAALAASLVLAAPAGAITYGSPDGNGHPEVGALLAPEAYSDGTWAVCTGTLISPTVFLTAAHCDQGLARVSVTFDSAYQAPGTTHTGTYHADPAYNQAQSDTHDLAVVVLDKPVKGIVPARLPKAGSLSTLTGAQTFTSVGYGANAVTQQPGGKTFTYSDVRYVSSGTLNSLTPTWLRISQNPSTGNAGTCYGDSGGPNFLGSGRTETNIVAGTTITGDMFCRSTNVDYRLDTPSARGFLGQFVTLP